MRRETHADLHRGNTRKQSYLTEETRFLSLLFSHSFLFYHFCVSLLFSLSSRFLLFVTIFFVPILFILFSVHRFVFRVFFISLLLLLDRIYFLFLISFCFFRPVSDVCRRGGFILIDVSSTHTKGPIYR